MDRTTWGLVAMLISLLLGTTISLGSLAAMRGRLDTAALSAQPLNVSTLLVTCLDPFAILLEIVAIVLIVMDSHRVGGIHRRLAWTAAFFFAIWAIANFGGFLPLSFAGMQRGSVSIVKFAQMIKAGAAILQYSIPFLLAFGLTREASRLFLWLALALTVVGNFGVVALPIKGIQLQPVETMGRTMYVPRFNVNYTTGPYPILLALGHIGGALYMIVYALTAWRRWKEGLIQVK